MPTRRPKGTGSLFQRADGVWLAQVNIGQPRGPRRVKSFCSRDRAVVEARLAAWLEENPPKPTMNMKENLAHRSAIRGHTQKQWWAKFRADPHCAYCGVKLMVRRNLSRDHVIPISRGGTDDLDNVVACCRDCNQAKYTMTGDEFRAWRAGAA